MGHDRVACGPSRLIEHLHGARDRDHAIALGRIYLQHVMVLAHAAERDEVPHVLLREQVLARRERRLVDLGQLGHQRVVERVGRLLVPAQLVGREHLRIGACFVGCEAAIGIDGEVPAIVADQLEHRLEPLDVLGDGGAAHFHLELGVTHVEIAAHLVEQFGDALAGRVPAAAHIDEHVGLFAAGIVAIRDRLVGGLLLDLGDRVPHGDLDGADAHRAVGMPAGLLALHHGGEDRLRVEIAPFLVDQAVGVGVHDPRDEPRPHLGTAGIPPRGVEGVADDGLAVADHVGDDRDDGGGHLAEVEHRVAQVRVERDRGFADVGDLHGCLFTMLQSSTPSSHRHART